MKKVISIVLACFAISACAPEVGSKSWCEAMDKKSKGDWTATEAKDYTKHCIFKSDEE